VNGGVLVNTGSRLVLVTLGDGAVRELYGPREEE
jgi:hypothetical protein